MLVSICIPTVRAHSVGMTIESILRQSVGEWELIVVPQGNDKDMHTLLERYQAADSRIRVVAVEWKNANHARNVGVGAARGDVVAFTDDDCEAASDWVDVIRDVFKTRPNVGYLGGEVVAPPRDRRWTISTCPSAHVIEAEYSPSRSGFRAPDGFYMIGANIAVRREVLDLIGPFDTTLGPGTAFPSCEEQDYGLRAESLDVTLMTTKRLVVYHTGGRRYGLRSFLAHQRNYARGRGAWLAKLQMANHRLASEWGSSPTLNQEIRFLVRAPHRWLLHMYGRRHSSAALREFRASYELGPDFVCKPRGVASEGQA